MNIQEDAERAWRSIFLDVRCFIFLLVGIGLLLLTLAGCATYDAVAHASRCFWDTV